MRRKNRSPEPTVQAHLDAIGPTDVSGWARLTSEPETRVSLILLIDGEIVARSTADRFRHDLADSTFCGHHGFRIPIPEQWFDGKEHTIQVVIDGAAADYPVVGTLLQKQRQTLQEQKRGWTGLYERALAACKEDKVDTVRLSIIMPTFNRAARMEKTCRGLLRLAQDLPVELIVVDDGSTDQTQAALRRLEGDFPDRVRSQRISNSGPGRARNIGAAMANGAILLFMGDDTEPVDQNFLATHILFHAKKPDRHVAVLGKTRWRDHSEQPTSFVMKRVQGEGQQQFGYQYMRPYHVYDWQLFYSSNVSVKRDVVADWMEEGFSADFTLAAYEDPEFAYRMEKAFGRFEVHYAPSAVLAHDHPYTVESFLRRQGNAGRMAYVFVGKHPEVAHRIGVDALMSALQSPQPYNSPDLYVSVIAGIKAAAQLAESDYAPGSQNWHGIALDAVFELAYHEGFLAAIAQHDPTLNYAAGLRYAIESFRKNISGALTQELFGDQRFLAEVNL